MTEVRPALQFERLLETMFALANDGKTNTKGMPNPLRLAVIANAHFDDVRLPFPPAWMQKLGLAMGAPLGRALGFKPEYDGAEAARTGSARPLERPRRTCPGDSPWDTSVSAEGISGLRTRRRRRPRA